MSKVLTLWDIDGTLVNVYEHHTPSYQESILQVYNIILTLEEIERNYGKPASEVVAIPVREKGLRESRIQEGLERAFSLYAQELARRIKEANSGAKSAILPGVQELLERLVLEEIPRGAVTGNIRLAGETILSTANLSQFFNPEINTYADQTTAKRAMIIKNALTNAKRIGIYNENTKVFVFGDTPSDVEAARENSCISVAVIKNSNTQESSPGGIEYEKRKKILEASNPDILLDDLTETEFILDKVYSLAR